ncbi:carbohydrate sulfotransferase 14-like [Hyalella azteca]|uniref:Carbohydrate sulfotransferase n=1 Tax=Hyalella azteca TaxID=294128 RepID=A0A8B7P607_HYAAZ|nr:carbohydrate sulfotransferase 14-like [Hyalella azteca]
MEKKILQVMHCRNYHPSLIFFVSFFCFTCLMLTKFPEKIRIIAPHQNYSCQTENALKTGFATSWKSPENVYREDRSAINASLFHVFERQLNARVALRTTIRILRNKYQNNSLNRYQLKIQPKIPRLHKRLEVKEPPSLQAILFDYKQNKSRSSHVINFPGNKNIDERKYNKLAEKLDWEEMQKNKIDRLRKICKKTTDNYHHPTLDELSNRREKLRNILVDDRHKLLYCYVPKVACSQIKRVILKSSGLTSKDHLKIPQRRVHHLSYMLALSNPFYTREEVKRRLTTYKTVIFSRHPMERILSAYRDKFEANSNEAQVFSRIYGPLMLNFINKTATYLEKSMKMSIAFSDMLEYLSISPPENDQEHWKPLYHICHPCTIDYQYIGEFNSLAQDGKEIFNRVLGSDNVEFPSVIHSATSELIPKYLANVLPGIIRKFREVFRLDYELFGYL